MGDCWEIVGLFWENRDNYSHFLKTGYELYSYVPGPGAEVELMDIAEDSPGERGDFSGLPKPWKVSPTPRLGLADIVRRVIHAI